MPKSKDRRYWLYDQEYNDVGSFLMYLHDLIKQAKVKINILLVASHGNIREELESWIPETFNVTIKHRLPVFSMDIRKEFEERPPITVQATVVKYDTSTPIYLVVSDCTAVDFKHVVGKLLSKHYPNISKIFLTNNEMFSIFRGLEEETGCEIMVDSSIGKKRIWRPGKKKESQVTYTNAPYDEVFDEIISRDAWVQLIKFTATKSHIVPEQVENTYAYSGVISRDCFFSIRGDFKPFIQHVIPRAVGFASARVEYLEERAKTASKPKPEPIVIRFDEQVFTDKSKNRRYIDAIAELEAASISEYHTNPYIHVSMLDYLDGSSYDIWVVSDDKMIIIPQYSATSASMGRLVNHVFQRIQEGKVEQYAKPAIAANN